MELLNKKHKRDLRAVLTVCLLRRISERVVTKLIKKIPLVCLGIMSATWPQQQRGAR